MSVTSALSNAIFVPPFCSTSSNCTTSPSAPPAAASSCPTRRRRAGTTRCAAVSARPSSSLWQSRAISSTSWGSGSRASAGRSRQARHADRVGQRLPRPDAAHGFRAARRRNACRNAALPAIVSSSRSPRRCNCSPGAVELANIRILREAGVSDRDRRPPSAPASPAWATCASAVLTASRSIAPMSPTCRIAASTD